MTAPFAITADQPTVALDAAGRAEVGFDVENQLGREVLAIARADPDGAAPAGWLAVEQPAELDLTATGSGRFVVDISVPAGAQPGTYSFALVVADVANPDDVHARGASVRFAVGQPAPPPAKIEPGYVPTFWGAVAGDVVGAAAGIVPAVIAFFANAKTDPLAAVLLAIILGVGGVAIGASLGAPLGLWIALRWRGYRYGGWTAAALLFLQPVAFVLLAVMVTVATRSLPSAFRDAGFLLVLVVVAGLTPFAARMLVLWRVGAFVPPWQTGVTLTRTDGLGATAGIRVPTWLLVVVALLVVLLIGSIACSGTHGNDPNDPGWLGRLLGVP
jgi:MFS family permease